jgi:opacity protein-like surface antigen
MKRMVCILAILGLIGLCLPAQSQAQSKFSIRLSGGLNMLDGGDLNTGAEGLFDFWDALVRGLGNTTSGVFSAANLGLNFGGDFIFKFNENMGVGLGAGMLSASKESVMSFSNPGGHGDFTHKVTASAVPLRLSFFYYLPVGSTMNVVFNAGLGYYLAKANYLLTVTGGGTTVTMESDASGSGLGFHGGLGLEIALMPNLGILVDLSGRFASFGGFEGKEIDNGATAVSGKLYAYDLSSTLGNFHVIVIDNTLPSGVGISHAAEAKVSFTGFSFVAGFFFRF